MSSSSSSSPASGSGWLSGVSRQVLFAAITGIAAGVIATTAIFKKKAAVSADVSLLDPTRIDVVSSKNLSRRLRIVTFGDSITQQGYELAGGDWVARLADYYTRKADIINRGYSGYNTKWALELLRGQIKAGLWREHADLITIFFGANDASFVGVSGNQHVDVSDYVEYMKQIIQTLQDANLGHKFILITAPPVDSAAWIVEKVKKYNEPAVEDRSNAEVLKYVEALEKLGQERKLPVINLYKLLLDSTAKWESHLSDGLHLSSSGAELLFKALKRTIETEFPEFNADKLPMDAPWFKDIPAKSSGTFFTA